MSAARLSLLWRAARRRRQAIVWSQGVPLALLAAALAWRWAGPSMAMAVATVALLATAASGVLRARRLDRRWLVRRLDRDRDLEDSADLLFADPAALGPLQRLQRARVEARLGSGARDLREPWPWRSILPLALAALVLASLALRWPMHGQRPSAPAARDEASAPASRAPALRAARLHATPPAYTGQAPSTLPSLDAKVPQGTQLAWTLRFEPQPMRVALRLHDGSTLELVRDGDAWQARMALQRSALYRVIVDGKPLDGAPHKLEALPDRPPQVRVLEPESSLVQWTPTRAGWALRFEASDDYGVAAGAQLKLTLAQGSGENIRFREQTVALAGSGPATLRRFAHTLQPQALGMAPGDDLIAQLVVRDTRQPAPQEARSASVILRWPPPEQALATDLEGSVKKTLPAYFRSQRQIILDAEALLKEKPRLDPDAFLKRSDAIGVDQRLLRLRYGQFLGEESEGAPKPPPADDIPSADAPPTADLPTADAPAPRPEPARDAHAGHDHDEAPQGAAALDDHDHDHDAHGSAGFGQAGNVLAEFGHTHDHAEAATLLDPKTRATLKAALDQMWQSEGELRQGRPAQALPHAYKALEYIKQVQQSERIYLARVGPELPPIDEGRRMSGQRDGLARRGDALVARTAPDPRPMALWQALGAADRAAASVALDDFAAWLGAHQGSIENALDLAAAVETLRATPDCGACRQRLRALVWPLLVRPPAAPAPRAPASERGRRYLDALQRQEDAR
ncbi:hypothetical protein [[Pseudomonas] boreopolis]|uniref:hypothetical protein n=1 Tax=Xanthomonas boreopolis TaxID=86183 RepID=UPI003D9B8D64